MKHSLNCSCVYFYNYLIVSFHTQSSLCHISLQSVTALQHWVLLPVTLSSFWSMIVKVHQQTKCTGFRLRWPSGWWPSRYPWWRIAAWDETHLKCRTNISITSLSAETTFFASFVGIAFATSWSNLTQSVCTDYRKKRLVELAQQSRCQCGTLVTSLVLDEALDDPSWAFYSSVGRQDKTSPVNQHNNIKVWP